MLEKNFTIVDIETTGGSLAGGRVIELGIIRVEREEVVAEYQSFINPGQKLSSFISSLTGITDEDVVNAPYFEEIAEDLLPLFEDSVFVAHNSSFDYRFLKVAFERADLAFTMETLCTVRLSRALYPKYKKHNLSALIDRFELTCQNRHRAFDDAKVVWDFLQLLKLEFPPEILNAAIERSLKKIPPKQQQKLKSTRPQIIYEPYSF